MTYFPPYSLYLKRRGDIRSWKTLWLILAAFPHFLSPRLWFPWIKAPTLSLDPLRVSRNPAGAGSHSSELFFGRTSTALGSCSEKRKSLSQMANPPLLRMLLVDLAAPSPASAASGASCSGIWSTGIFVVIAPYFTGPCSAVLNTLGFWWEAVIPAGTVCLSVCLSVLSVF